MKKYENHDNYRERVHTIQVTFQSGEYKGRIAYEVGGNCFGLDLLEFSPETIDQDDIDRLVTNDCNFSYDEDFGRFTLRLKDENDNTLFCEEDNSGLECMVVALEIIDCKIIERDGENA